MRFIFTALAGLTMAATTLPSPAADLNPTQWRADYERFLSDQNVVRTEAGHASGSNGAVTVAYNGLAARAGLEALKQGGNAIDAALTAANMQVALTAGAPISYFGILSLVYYDAKSGKVYTMNAEWNTVRGETEPMSIPGSLTMSGSLDALRGSQPSGRTALVGGFTKGVEAAHKRFGRLPFAQLYEPAIYVAEQGMPVTDGLAGYLAFRDADLRRLPATRATFTKADGSSYRQGDLFRQPALAKTLRGIARNGADYIYRGPWAKKAVAAIQADGGKMTLQDLAAYDVIWSDPLIANVGRYQIQTNPAPNSGGAALIEAQQLARAAGLPGGEHWSKSGASLRKAIDVSQMVWLDFLPDATRAQLYPGMDFSPQARITPEHANDLWKRMQAGVTPFRFATPKPRHSDDVVVIDRDGNIAAITHSINAVLWGRTAISVDGISIGDPASFQQAQIAKVGPGKRLPAVTETGILFKDGRAVLGFASMGSGLHQRTMQALLNVTEFGMSVREAIDAPDFFMPRTDPKSMQLTVVVPKGRFEQSVLDAMGYDYDEADSEQSRFAGEGIWVGISRDPATGRLEAASHNRNNSAAVAF
ncbi:gamma-glutamyltransferase [Peristeroidobacter soli]|uniref:gamma-glutamyltransferase n=1 Tax=Peristeroidobacter soli TaxID=2497877 RepID=UPI00101D19DE|nr:gamma-glutamyltransferase [Peristeroidobacter soli]